MRMINMSVRGRAGSILVLALLLASVASWGQEPSPKTPGPPPKPAALDLELSLALEHDRFPAGGTVRAQVRLSNRSSRAIRLPLEMDRIDLFDGTLAHAVRLKVVDAEGRHHGIGAFGNFNRGPQRIELVVPARGVLNASVESRLGYSLAKGGVRKDLSPGSYQLYAVLGDRPGGWSPRSPPAKVIRSKAIPISVGKKAARLRIEDLGWLTGKWTGGHDDVIFEESWSTPAAGSMLGTFRWMERGRVRFYEFLLIEEDAEGAVLRFKHFSPKYRPWEKEEPITLRVTQERKGCMVLTNLKEEASPTRVTYTRSGSEDLVVTIESRGKDGKPSTLKLEFKRKS